MAVPQNKNSRWPWLLIALVPAIVALWACVKMLSRDDTTSPMVLLVFPTNFRGLARVCTADKGDPTTIGSGARIEFDSSGRCIHGHANSLLDWSHLIVQLADGTILPLWDSNYRAPKPGEHLGVWQGGGPNGKNGCVYFYVGSPQDSDLFDRAALRETYGSDGDKLLPKTSQK